MTALTTGIVQADGLLQSLDLPLQVVQYAYAGVELVFIGSASALIYEVGAWAWKQVATPRPRTQQDGRELNDLVKRRDQARQVLAKLDAAIAEKSQHQPPAGASAESAQQAAPQPPATKASPAEPQSDFVKAVADAAEGGKN